MLMAEMFTALMVPFLHFLKRSDDQSLLRCTKTAEGTFGWSVEADLT